MVGTPRDEAESRKERLGSLVRINEKVAEVTEATAEAAALALEAAEEARRARKRKRAKTTDLKPSTAPDVTHVLAPPTDTDEPTVLSAPPPETQPATRHRRRNVISLRLDDAEFDKVKKLAARTGLPLAASVRSLLLQALERADRTSSRSGARQRDAHQETRP